MSNYFQTTDFSAKDSLTTGDPEKIVLGADFDVEFENIATAIATKFDGDSVASQVEAVAGSANNVVMTPLRTTQWASANAGIVSQLRGLTDPDADRILFWDDSAGSAAFLSVGSNLSLSGTALDVGSNVPLLNADNSFTGSNQYFAAASPALWWSSTGAAANQGLTRFATDNTGFYLSSANDGGNVGETVIIGQRSGTEWTFLGLAADQITLNGVDVSDYARLSESNTFTSPNQQIRPSGGNSASLRLAANAGTPGTTSLDLEQGPGGTGYLYNRLGEAIEFGTNNTTRARITGAGVFEYGGIEVGYRNLPTYGGSGAIGGMRHDVTSGVTIPTGTPANTTWVVYNASDSAVTLTQGSGLTLRLGGTTSTGNRTLLPRGFATFHAISTTEYVVTGHVS